MQLHQIYKFVNALQEQMLKGSLRFLMPDWLYKTYKSIA